MMLTGKILSNTHHCFIWSTVEQRDSNIWPQMHTVTWKHSFMKNLLFWVDPGKMISSYLEANFVLTFVSLPCHTID